MQNFTLFGCPKGADGRIVVLGLPFDHGSIAHPGCSKAPYILRHLTAPLHLAQGYLWDNRTRSKILENVELSDLGNIQYRATQSKLAYLESIAKATAALTTNGKKVLSLGGDHLVTLPILSGFASTYDVFQVLQIDAHTDFQIPEEGELPSHANFVYFAVRERQISRWVQVGVRGVSRELFPLAEHVIQTSIDTLEKALLPDVPVYLTIDTDGFDPSIAPAVGHPVIGGLSWKDLSDMLKLIADKGCQIIGADWVEYNPFYDSENQISAQGIISSLLQIVKAMA